MNTSHYTRKELTKLARSACRSHGRYQRWELNVSNLGATLQVHFKCKVDGCSASLSVAL